MHVEHEEKELLWHLGDHAEIDHLVGGADAAAIGVLFGLLGRQVVVDFGGVGVGGEEGVIVDLLRLLGEIEDLLIDLF